jgi:hypothetical protein
MSETIISLILEPVHINLPNGFFPGAAGSVPIDQYSDSRNTPIAGILKIDPWIGDPDSLTSPGEEQYIIRRRGA